MRVGLLRGEWTVLMYTPPPSRFALLPLKTQSVTVELLSWSNIPAPLSALLPARIQLVTVGLLLMQIIPFPGNVGVGPIGLPFRIVKPLRMEAAVSPLVKLKPPPLTWQSMMHRVGSLLSERTVMALPLKSMGGYEPV